MARQGDDVYRLSFQEQMELIKLPSDSSAKKYMSTRSAYMPGSDFTKDKELPSFHKAAFGGCVYGQAALAALRAQRELEAEEGRKPSDRLDIHTINGFFTRPGVSDKPFIYSASPITSSRSFSTMSISASHPTSSSVTDHFSPSTTSLNSLQPPAFAALISFKLPEPDSAGISMQEPSPQQRFSSILSSRPPEDWPAAPPVDLEGVVSLVGDDQIGTFPIVEMKKVDMTFWNQDKPIYERRELILYRLLKPLSPTEGDGPNAHIAVHAYAADRNGLLMAANHLGLGWSLGRAASLSYSFVVHVNAAEAVLEGKGWWVQEVWFPRAARGRGIVECKIWSPEGVHVATEYQDGLIKGWEESDPKGVWKEEAKL
ncbi:thioesterase-like superfamily-domain-containing protein [Podospora fimiseda]|uniref:Thioesterase-like superfamily-domain-containing protein n=1 Tax=Podospora fimiseda TaxID=252190 RepID=A0AAN7GZJ6_9PEZI|nr:thioesterase-like superfamily-domain-containing protein [Podospora fimiseda]